MLDKESAKKAAIEYLSHREHSQQEISAKLSAKGIQPGDIQDILIWLKDKNLQSDARFTESFVNSRINKGHGPIKIAAELKAKGINASASALGLNENEWVELAQNVREKRFGKEFPTDQKQKAKQIRFLQYRGFSFDQVKCALNDNDY